MIATQNWGAAMPSTANSLPVLSKIESRLTAERIPNGMPTTIASSIPANASCSVAGNRSSSKSLVGLRSLIETPKSPTTAPRRKM